jgi:uncharacterized protein (DUF1778 family)
MTLTLELPPELEKSIKEAAAKAGAQPTDFVIETLQERLSKTVRGAPKNLSKRESELLLAVNESFAHVQWQRYFELIDEREAETITKDELAELVELSNEIEEANAKRLQYLIELAQLRNVSLEQLMDDLDLKPALPAYTSRVTPFQ